MEEALSRTPSTGQSTPKVNGTGESAVDIELERQAVRKLDYTILPVMTMFYLLSFLDRANIGNARVAGLQKDLNLSDHQYQICVTVLFVPYIAAELPSNLLLRKIGPSILMPTLLTTWGVMVTLQGLVTSYAGLVVVRAFLGLVEGPMFPGIVLYLSGFYTRRELSLRHAFYKTALLFGLIPKLSGAFSGLLAAAIEKMDGIGGRPGWAWIFILEGLFTVLMGLCGFFLVPSTPRDSKFLTHEQKEIIMRRLERDRPSINPSDKFTFKEILLSLCSPQVIMVFIMFFMIGTTLYGLALFLPSIVSQLGFSRDKTQLLSVGPFAAGFFVTLFSAFWSDRHESRGITTAIISTMAVAGFALYLGAKDKFAAYGALYLMVPGVYATAPVLSAWMANNSEPYYRRATSIALGFVATNSGGILSTWSYPTKDGPRFRNTTIMNLIFSILVVVGSLVNMMYLSRRNKSKQRPGQREKLLEKYTDEKGGDGGLKAWLELGDRHPDFRYTL
ncbi:MFS general substrate transporter [Crassisporium funariophilum]|nr:MFS general substrate transporter [Crassisporium funariophilum]